LRGLPFFAIFRRKARRFALAWLFIKPRLFSWLVARVFVLPYFCARLGIDARAIERANKKRRLCACALLLCFALLAYNLAPVLHLLAVLIQ